ncbi:MAG TPA: signal peptidase II [Verrucomicrobiae bacterium]|nr:signal peptidase II [Verrucomicrobiae bacterium]
MQWVALIAVTVAVLDQVTKWLVVRSLSEEEIRVVISGFFSLVNWPNTGTAWSILKDCNLVLAVVSLLALLGMYLFRHAFQLNRPGSRVALGLITGGIIGNLIDRVRVHHVTDFLYFYVGQYHWPAFNVADSAICIGVGLYLILSWRSDVAARKSQSAISS